MYIQSAIAALRALVKTKRGKIALGVVAVLLVGGIGVTLSREKAPAGAAVEERLPTVSLQSVAELSSAVSPLPIAATVVAKSEATLTAERPGRITSVRATLGESVLSGTVIATIENASESAALAQAKSGVAAAVASLAKIKKGPREEQLTILKLTVENAEAGFEAEQTSALTTISAAYASIEDAVRRKIDQTFSDPTTGNPRFNPSTANSQDALNLGSKRLAVQSILERERSVSASLLSGTTDIRSELTLAINEARQVRAFVESVALTLNGGISTSATSESTLATYRTDAAAAQTALASTLASLIASDQALTGKETALAIAEENYNQGLSGGQSEDVEAAEAALAQALAAEAAAEASYAKTVLRTPISGTVNSLLVAAGDYVSAYAPVATVANNNAVEIKGYVTGNDLRFIKVGSGARIERRVDGIVTAVAPAVDPVTKKAEVRIGVIGESNLQNGEGVSVELFRAPDETVGSKQGDLTIPISALKISGATISVFTVSSEGELIAHPIEIGPILGSKVVLVSGIDLLEYIVVDARGRKPGEKVEVLK